MNLESAIWDVPQRIRDHSKMIAAAGGGHIVATIQSWTPVKDCDFNFIKAGAHPDTYEDRFNELRNSLVGTVTPLNEATALLVIDQAAQDAIAAIRQNLEDEYDDLDFDISTFRRRENQSSPAAPTRTDSVSIIPRGGPRTSLLRR